jgi:hypothetical protein
LSAPSQSAVTVNYATANGSATAGQDYTAAAGTVTFAAGQTSQQIGVSVIGDSVVESNETFTVSLSSPSGAQLGAGSSATATIVNDDVQAAPPVVTISPANVAVTEGDAGPATARFTVSLSAPSQSAVTVNYATANGSATAGQDYTAAAGTVTFAAGQTTQQISLNVAGDRVVEPNETFTVTLSSPSGAQLGAASSATATIVNDDLALVSISPANLSIAEGNSGVASAVFTVSLSAVASTPVTVRYATGSTPGNKWSATAGQDYTAASGILTFAAGQTTQQFSVNVIGDTTAEVDETFAVTLSSPSGAQLGTAKVTATIANDDLAPVNKKV